MSISEDIAVRSATNADCDSVQKLVFGILREYGLEPAPEGIDQDIADIEKHYLDRGGIFEILETADGKLVGTVGLYPFDETRIELRKMYFAKEIRGMGLGKTTLKRIVETARNLSYDQLVLETASVLVEAIGLYRKFGFKEAKEKHTPRCDTSFYLDLK